MKNLRTSALCLCALLISVVSFSQKENDRINEPDYNKPKLFSNFPERIPLSIEKINDLLKTDVGQSANLKVATNASLQFDGEIVSKASKYENTIQSVVIRCANFNGATLTLSKITNADGTISYTGRIISFKHGDLYVLQGKGDDLTLVKKNYHELVNE